MRLWGTALCVAVTMSAVAAETNSKLPKSTPKAPESRPEAPQGTQVLKDLPVQKVVLYKNGIGYFEHAGTVVGSQRVAIDFTSPQLNDVLQSLTVLDEGGGRIAGVNYNSTTPLAEQLKTLSLGMTEDPTSTELFGALRGQRVEVTGAPGGPISGRLMSVESRTQETGSGDNAVSVEKFFLTVIAASGAVRVIELTPTLSVRPVDSSLQGQLDRYLELLSTTHSTGLRHLTLNAIGSGSRRLRVSYISEVPVWKCTYRLVFPRDPNGTATMQGWAVVDNTVGADWDNVQLSLVAGAPQSFIQPISQPLYTRRPEIAIATEAQTTPQTHEAAEIYAGSPPPPSAQPQIFGARKSLNQQLRSNFQNNVGGPLQTAQVQVEGKNFADMAAASPGVAMGGATGSGYGVYRPSDAISEGDVSTSAFDDFFEYSLAQPVTIHKNESAMVPILQQDLPAEHVTLWSRANPRPLRAVWLENKSKLTLDSGSFSIFESGEFAGEGLLDPIHPGERRLLSYATDQATRVKISDQQGTRTLHHLQVHKGIVLERYMDVASITYSATNSGDQDRVVLIEHPRHTNGWTLDGMKAAEATPDLYRLRIAVKPHSTEKLEVREHGPELTTVAIDPNQNTNAYLIELVKRVPDAEAELKPIIDAQARLADLDQAIAESKQQEQTAAADEARCRENLTALKGNEAAHRFVEELNHAEDQLQSTRKHTADLEQQKAAGIENLRAQINALNYDWDATIKD